MPAARNQQTIWKQYNANLIEGACDPNEGNSAINTQSGYGWGNVDLEKCSRQNYNGGCPVTRNNILTFAELHKHLGGWVSGLQMLHNGGTVVGDENLRRDLGLQ